MEGGGIQRAKLDCFGQSADAQAVQFGFGVLMVSGGKRPRGAGGPAVDAFNELAQPELPGVPHTPDQQGAELVPAAAALRPPPGRRAGEAPAIAGGKVFANSV